MRAQFMQYGLKDAFDIAHTSVFANRSTRYPCVSRNRVLYSVSTFVRRVVRAIDLNDQPLRQTDEVYDVTDNRVLATKFERTEPSRTQPTPQQALDVSGITTKAPRPRDRRTGTIVSPHGCDDVRSERAQQAPT